MSSPHAPRPTGQPVLGAHRKKISWMLLGILITAVTLGPFWAFEVPFATWLGTTMDQVRPHPWLLSAVIVAVLAGDCVLPVPSSLISVFAGATLGWVVAAGVIWVGMCMGCLSAYLLGASGGRLFALRLLGDAELARAQGWFSRIGPAALVATRAVPVLAEAGAIAAGLVRMPLRTFLVSTAAANALVALAFAIAGAWGESLVPAFLVVLILPAVGWAVWRYFFNQ